MWTCPACTLAYPYNWPRYPYALCKQCYHTPHIVNAYRESAEASVNYEGPSGPSGPIGHPGPQGEPGIPEALPYDLYTSGQFDDAPMAEELPPYDPSIPFVEKELNQYSDLPFDIEDGTIRPGRDMMAYWLAAMDTDALVTVLLKVAHKSPVALRHAISEVQKWDSQPLEAYYRTKAFTPSNPADAELNYMFNNVNAKFGKALKNLVDDTLRGMNPCGEIPIGKPEEMRIDAPDWLTAEQHRELMELKEHYERYRGTDKPDKNGDVYLSSGLPIQVQDPEPEFTTNHGPNTYPRGLPGVPITMLDPPETPPLTVDIHDPSVPADAYDCIVGGVAIGHLPFAEQETFKAIWQKVMNDQRNITPLHTADNDPEQFFFKMMTQLADSVHFETGPGYDFAEFQSRVRAKLRCGYQCSCVGQAECDAQNRSHFAEGWFEVRKEFYEEGKITRDYTEYKYRRILPPLFPGEVRNVPVVDLSQGTTYKVDHEALWGPSPIENEFKKWNDKKAEQRFAEAILGPAFAPKEWHLDPPPVRHPKVIEAMMAEEDQRFLAAVKEIGTVDEEERVKKREDAFMRKIVPPPMIADDELDRSTPMREHVDDELDLSVVNDPDQEIAFARKIIPPIQISDDGLDRTIPSPPFAWRDGVFGMVTVDVSGLCPEDVASFRSAEWDILSRTLPVTSVSTYRPRVPGQIVTVAGDLVKRSKKEMNEEIARLNAAAGYPVE